MQYTYRIKERKDGEPPISIVEIMDQEPGDYVTISFAEHKQVHMESNNVAPTYYKYECPNRVHLFALLGDTETCIYCYVKDNPPKGGE